MRYMDRCPSLMNILPELLAYGLVSGLALLVDMSVLLALVSRAGWNYLPASTLSFVAGGTVAYALSIRYVFRFRSVSSRRLEYGYFVALGLVGLAVNAAALSVAITAVGLGLVAAKLLAACCTFAANFALRRQLLFSRPEMS